jgi:outer membrane protein assembly factor BamB
LIRRWLLPYDARKRIAHFDRLFTVEKGLAMNSARRRFLELASLLSATAVVRCTFRNDLALAAEPVSDPKFAWPQFLGPQRTGISPERGLLAKWPEGGPKVLWRVPGGVGMSGIVIDNNKALTMIERDGKQVLVCLSADKGEEQWEREIAPAYKNQMGNGTRGTPTIAADRVFVFTGEGILAAVNFADGKLLWSKNVVAELKGQPAEYGMACSPLVVGDQVIVTVGAPKGSVAAINVASGELAWKTGNDPAGYSSPALLTLDEKPQIVASTGTAVMGIEPKGGRMIWRHPFETDFNCNIATPIAYQNQVFISAGENHGCALLKVSADSGAEGTEVWSSLGPKSVMRNEWQTSILLGDHLYGFDNVGGAGPVSHLTCISAKTGERAWQEARFGKGNLIAADGKLFMTTMRGELVIARASPKAYEEIGRATYISGTRQAPSLSNGRLYLRDDKEIVCLDVR